MGYKYVTDEFSWKNFEVYMEKATSGNTLHFSELDNTAGFHDKETFEGIYFCQTFEELYPWVDELFDCGEIRCLDIIEVIPVGEVKERSYDGGRIALVSNTVIVRLIHDLPDALRDLIAESIENFV